MNTEKALEYLRQEWRKAKQMEDNGYTPDGVSKETIKRYALETLKTAADHVKNHASLYTLHKDGYWRFTEHHQFNRKRTTKVGKGICEGGYCGAVNGVGPADNQRKTKCHHMLVVEALEAGSK